MQNNPPINVNIGLINAKFLLAVFSFVFVFISGLSAEAATLYLIPQSQTVYQEDAFISEVWVDAEQETINAVEGYLGFPSDKLEVIDISKGESILGLWLDEPIFSNQTGEISFIGGIPKGFGGQGKLLSIMFRVLPGLESRLSASVNFKEDSRVLLNDGNGTPAQLIFEEGNYEIIKKPGNLPAVSSDSHPDQNKWEQNKNFHLRWDIVEENQYSYILTKDPLTELDEIPDKPEGDLIWMGDMEYKGLEDGIYYFHLRQETRNAKQGLKWGPKATYRAMIDSTPPKPFELRISEIEGKKYLVFATIDNPSGVDRYEVYETQESIKGNGYYGGLTSIIWKTATSPYLLENQNLGSIMKVKAVDKAGNETIAEYLPPEKPKPFPYLAMIIILTAMGAGIGYWLYRKSKIKNQND